MTSEQKYISVFAEQILSPEKMSCRIHLGFGVTVTKFFTLRRRLRVTPENYDNAMRAMIVLCGRKRLLACVDTNATGETLPADLWTMARNPPDDLSMLQEDKLWLNVGPYMDDLQQTDFDHTVILKHLNGERLAASGQ